MTFFGLAPSISGWIGLLGYSAIFAIALISVFTISKIKVARSLSKTEFITFTVVTLTESSEYTLRVPKHMQVAIFLHKFITHLSKGPAKNNINFLNLYFHPVLQLKKKSIFADVNPHSSIAEAKIRNGSYCRIKAKPISENNEVMYSLG